MAGGKRQRVFLILAIVVIGGAVLLVNDYLLKQRRQASSAAAPSLPMTAEQQRLINLRPDFTLPDEVGLPRSIDEWQGKVIVLNFWATWCRPCLRETPMLIDTQRRYREQGVQFVGISFDDREAVETYKQRTGFDFNYPILIGEDEAIPIAKAYGNDAGILPFTVLIDRAGTIRDLKFGETTREELEDALNPLL